MAQHTALLRVTVVPTDDPTIYKSTIEEVGDGLGKVVLLTQDSEYWYRFGIKSTNEYLLRVYGRLFSERRPGSMLLLTESYECTLATWNGEKLSRDGTGLSTSFANFLIDILRAMSYLHDIKHPHGELCAENICIVNGRAKLSNIAEKQVGKRTLKRDLLMFVAMVKGLFNNIAMPSELSHLLTMISKKKDIESKDLLDFCFHPVFLDPVHRVDLRVLGETWARNENLSYILRFKLSLQLGAVPDWKSSPHIKHFDHLDHFDDFEPTGWAFMKLSKNACVHSNTLRRLHSVTAIDKHLTMAWPGFLSAQFAALQELSLVNRPKTT